VLRFLVEAPPGAAGPRVLCAELTLGERRFGQTAEALVDVAPVTGWKAVVPPAFGVRMSPERAYDPGQGRWALRPARAGDA
jgi:hypothetical protein